MATTQRMVFSFRTLFQRSYPFNYNMYCHRTFIASNLTPSVVAHGASFHSTSISLNQSSSVDENALSQEEIKDLQAASRIIFDQLPFSVGRSGNKILRKKFIGPAVTKDHYKSFENELRSVIPEFMTDIEERRKQKLAYLRRRGKGPPKKGEGKRAAKRSGKKK